MASASLLLPLCQHHESSALFEQNTSKIVNVIRMAGASFILLWQHHESSAMFEQIAALVAAIAATAECDNAALA